MTGFLRRMRNSSWLTFRAFVSDFAGFGRRRAVLAGVLVVVASVVEGSGLVLIIPLLNIFAGKSSTDDLTSTTNRTLALVGADTLAERIAVILVAAGILLLLRMFLVSWRQIVLTSLQVDYLTARQIGLIKALGAAPWSRISRLRHSRITHLLSNDVHRIGQTAMGLVQCSVALIVLAVQFAIALYLNPLLTLVALGLLTCAGLMGSTLLRGAHRLGDLVIGANLTLLNDAGQFLAAMKLATSQNLQGRFVGDFSTTLQAVAAAEIDYIRVQNRVRFRVTSIAIVVGACTALIGFLVLHIPAATLIGLLLVLSRMGAPATLLQGQAIEMIRSLPAFAHLQALQGELGDDSASRSPVPAPPFGDIAFDHVTYTYAQGDQSGATAGIRDLSLVIEAGRCLGIAGASGAGKTTLADLLVGLTSPQTGWIRVGGTLVELEAAPGWRDRLAYVSQDAFLKHDTVRDNLLWANPAADEEEIAWALAASGGDDVVARLPEGLDTVVGERGTLISGGERQRLAIARALLRRPDLLILDEATNAIDVEGERTLLRRLNEMKPALTIVMIAHRLESLAFCDRIVVIKDGRVARNEAMGPMGGGRPRTDLGETVFNTATDNAG